jgi:hypothetical protein
MNDLRRGLLAGALALAALAPAGAQEPTDEEKWDKIGDAALDVLGASLKQALREWMDSVPPASVERAATPAEWDQAEALCAAAGLGLSRVAALEQPGRRRALAGRELKAKSVEVELEDGLLVRRLQFEDRASAAAYTGCFLQHQLARPDPTAPSVVTALEGPGATRALLASVEAACAGAFSLPDLTAVVGQAEKQRIDLDLDPRIPDDVPAGAGLRVSTTEGLRLERLRFDDAASARDFAGRHVREEGGRCVADARGRDLVVLSGDLDDPAVAARVLRACWRVAPPTGGERAGLVVLATHVRSYLALTGDGALHAQAARRVARARGGPDPERERFLDAPRHNDLRFRERDALYGQATLLRGGAIFVEARDKAEHERERRYLTELARALDVELPPAASATVEARAP